MVFNLQRQGAGRPLLHLTRAIFRLLYALDIRLFVSHIPGKENDFVDALSRMEVTGDYSLKSDVYRNALQMLQIEPTIDLFAHVQNYKCPGYAALPNLAQGLSKGAAVMDAFTIDWRRETPYIFPPVQIIDRVLRRIQDDKVTAVLVLPEWPGRPWWNLFVPMARAVIGLGQSAHVLEPGPAMRQSSTQKRLPPGLLLMSLVKPR
jgi:hypothetical protein